MNAHPQIGLLLAGPLAPADLPGELDAAASMLSHAPSRADASSAPLPDLRRDPPNAHPAARVSPWRRVALVVSILAHAGLAYAIGDRLARGPVEANDPEAISVELVLEAPAPAMPAAARAGAAATGAGSTMPAGTADETSVHVPDFDPALALTPPRIDPDTEFGSPRPGASWPPSPANAERQPVAVPPPAAATLALLASPPRLPEPANPVAPAATASPAAKPAAPAAATPARTKPTAQRQPADAKPAKAKTPKPAAASAKPEPAATARMQPHRESGKAAKTGNGGRTAGSAAKPAGASAAAKAAYSAKLLAHVQRFKRVPAAAKGASGTARLVVTIGRDGGLRGAKLAGSAGNAALNAEALATARRASPYPRPPEGIGGATISFGVSVRFAR